MEGSVVAFHPQPPWQLSTVRVVFILLLTKVGFAQRAGSPGFLWLSCINIVSLLDQLDTRLPKWLVLNSQSTCTSRKINSRLRYFALSLSHSVSAAPLSYDTTSICRTGGGNPSSRLCPVLVLFPGAWMVDSARVRVPFSFLKTRVSAQPLQRAQSSICLNRTSGRTFQVSPTAGSDLTGSRILYGVFRTLCVPTLRHG